MVCTKVKGEPIYEVVKPIPMHQEIIVFYLPERPEELFFSRMRNTIYRQTMDSILEGESAATSLLPNYVMILNLCKLFLLRKKTRRGLALFPTDRQSLRRTFRAAEEQDYNYMPLGFVTIIFILFFFPHRLGTQQSSLSRFPFTFLHLM